MVTQAPAARLTSVELSLVDHVSRGELLDLAAGDGEIDQAAMRSWGESRTCRASVIRDILRGRLAAGPDPHGLRLRGARITGRIDLENVTTDVSFELTDCFLEEGLLARGARLVTLVLAGCLLEHPAEPPLDAERLTCSVLDLTGATIIGHANNGTVRLVGAHIDGPLVCGGAALVNDSGPALLADELEVGQNVFLGGGFTATGAGGLGAVRLLGAHIGGQLNCTGASLRDDSGPALDAESLQVDQAMVLTGGFTGTGVGGAVDLSSAHIGGTLTCEGASLRNDSGPALSAPSLEVGQNVYLHGGFTATGAGGLGAVNLLGAHIGGQLTCTGASLRNDSGPALLADSLKVDRDIFLAGKFTATGAGGAVRLVGAHIGGQLSCAGASLSNDSGPALVADSLQVARRMSLTGGFSAVGAGGLGAVFLLGAHIGGQLTCTGASLRNDSGPALAADSLQVNQSMLLTGGFTATGAGGLGAVRLRGAHIGGTLDCTGASLRNDSGDALSAESLQVNQGMFLTGGFTATSAGEGGAVRLLGAHIDGQLGCTEANLRNDSGPALAADSLQADQDMVLSGGFTGAGEGGAVRLVGAHIDGQLNCIGANLRNDSGPALHADSLQVGRAMFLTGKFAATGAGGAVRLVGAHIGGQLGCTGAKLHNDSGPAVYADGLQVAQSMSLTGKFTATGAGGDGAVRLLGAHIGGQLDCTGASLRNDSGPALHADGLEVDEGMLLRGKFTATGAGELGAVRLVVAHIGGQLDCADAGLRNDSGPALLADSLQVGQGMFLRGEFTATGAGGGGVTVNLTDARVGGTLVFRPARLEHATDPQGRLAVNGLTYTGVPGQIFAGYWLRLLRVGTRGYAAQPYQQLAAGHRALGHERQAREILMAQRADQLARTDPGWPERLWGRITKVTLGYGYQPWRALLFLAGVVALSCLLAAVLGSHGALAQTSNTATPGRSCTVIQQASVGLDLNLPIGKSITRDRCDLAKDSASVTAAWLTAAGWVLQLLAWAFAALFIAGFTSAVRKT